MGPLNIYGSAWSPRRSLLGFGLAAALLIALATVIVPSKVVAEEGHRPFACTHDQPCVIGDTYNADGSRKADQIYVLSHGATDTVQNIFFSGLTSVLAKPYGGEHDGVGTYEIQPTSLPEVKSWEACAPDSSGYCRPSMSPQHFRIARYGDGQKWVYQQVSDRFACPIPGSPATTFAGMLLNPETGGWGFDPNRIVSIKANSSGVAVGVANDRAGTRCEISAESFPAIEGAFWTTCAASKEAVCKFPTPGTYLVRLRAGANSDTSQTFAYRSVTGSKIKCGAGINNASGATGSTLSCEYLAIPTFLSVRGEWSLVGLCANCGDINFQVASGMEQGSAKEEETGFAWQLGVTLSARAGDDTNNVESSRSVKYSKDNKDIVNNSFTQKQNTEFFVECGSGALYQWVTGVVERCMPRSTSCVSVARSNIFRCLPTSMPAGASPITDLPTAPSGFASFGSTSSVPEAPPAPRTFTAEELAEQERQREARSARDRANREIADAEAARNRKEECRNWWPTKISRGASVPRDQFQRMFGAEITLGLSPVLPNRTVAPNVTLPQFMIYCEKSENFEKVRVKATLLPRLSR